MPSDHDATPAAGALAPFEAWIVAGLVVYFAARVVFLAFNLTAGMPPDEIAHMRRVDAFVQPPGDPGVWAAASYIPGEPSLYYHVAALLVRLNVFPISNVVFLRLFSAALGVATVLYGWRWVRCFTPNPLARILFVIVVTNTLMFTAMFASVSYDPLMLFCAAAVIHHATRYWLERSPAQLLLMLIFMGIGTLTKTAFLPFAAIVAACVAVYMLRHVRPLRVADLVNTKRRAALCAVMLLVVAANAWLYGANLIRHGRLVPTKDQVYSDTDYMKSPVWARNTITHDYKLGRLSLGQAILMAREIDNEHVRRDTEYLLLREAANRQKGLDFAPLPRFVYPIPWLRVMAETAFGLLAHKTALKTGVWLMPYGALAAMAIAGLFMHWRPWRPDGVENYMIVIVAFYAIVLMQLVNYKAYLRSEELNVTLQGRYLFPVLVPAAGLFAHYYLAPWSRRIQFGLFALAAIIFLAGDLPFFLLTEDTAQFFGAP